MLNDNECKYCGEPLRFDGRSDLRYCGVRCRVAAFRQRQRERKATLAWLGEQQRRLAPADETWTQLLPPPAPPQPEPLEDEIDVWLRTPIRL